MNELALIDQTKQEMDLCQSVPDYMELLRKLTGLEALASHLEKYGEREKYCGGARFLCEWYIGKELVSLNLRRYSSRSEQEREVLPSLENMGIKRAKSAACHALFKAFEDAEEINAYIAQVNLLDPWIAPRAHHFEYGQRKVAPWSAVSHLNKKGLLTLNKRPIDKEVKAVSGELIRMPNSTGSKISSDENGNITMTESSFKIYQNIINRFDEIVMCMEDLKKKKVKTLTLLEVETLLTKGNLDGEF